MNYLQTLFGFFNAPLFATFILGMFWKRMTPTAGWVGLVSGTVSAVVVGLPHRGRLRLAAAPGAIPVGGQGAAFLAASAAFVVDMVLSIVVSLVTKPKPAEELKGLVYSETPREDLVDAGRGVLPVVPPHHPARQRLAGAWSSSSTSPSEEDDMASDTVAARQQQHRPAPSTSATSSVPCSAIYGVILVLAGDLRRHRAGARPAASTPTSGPGWRCSSSAAWFLAWARLRPVVVPADVHKDDEAAGRSAPAGTDHWGRRRRPGYGHSRRGRCRIQSGGGWVVVRVWGGGGTRVVPSIGVDPDLPGGVVDDAVVVPAQQDQVVPGRWVRGRPSARCGGRGP